MTSAVRSEDLVVLRERVDELETGYGRTLAEAAGARKAAESADRVAKNTFERVALFDAKLNELTREQRKTNRRVESFEDLTEAKEKSDLIRENRRLRSLPAKVAKWAGWGIGIAAGLMELAHRLGWIR